MNDADIHKAHKLTSPLPRGELCELCACRDQEDIYIVFDVLYRVLMMERFHEKSLKNELYYEMNQSAEPQAEQPQKDPVEESNGQYNKLTSFHAKISEKLLFEIFLTSSFNQLIQEIFKIKYHKLGETTCDHHILAREYLDMFGPPTESFVHDKEIVHQTQEKFEHLKTSIKEVKLNIDSCNAEINDLCSHILNRLFDPRPQVLRKETNEEESKMDSGENGSSGDGKDSSDEKFKSNRTTSKPSSNNNGTSSGSHSSGNNGNNGNQESAMDGSSSNGNTSGNARASSDQSDSNPRNQIKKTKHNYMTAKSKLPKRATDILKNWFLANIQNPYPSYEAKEQLSKMTNLTKKQIQNWFTNSRKRFLEPLRKKLQSNQDLNIGDMNSPAGNRFSNENLLSQNSEVAKPEDPPRFITEPNTFQQFPEPTFQPQPQPNLTYMAPPNYNQPMIYQAHMATNPNGGTFMNPIVYSYRPVQNFVPVNNNYIQFQPNHMQVINQPYIEQPYMIPSNMMNYRGIVTQSLSTNYNTINNNVYNSINTIGTEDVSSTNILNVNSSSSHAFDAGQEKNCGLLPKPDMDVEQTLNGKNLPDGEEK